MSVLTKEDFKKIAPHNQLVFSTEWDPGEILGWTICYNDENTYLLINKELKKFVRPKKELEDLFCGIQVLNKSFGELFIGL